MAAKDALVCDEDIVKRVFDPANDEETSLFLRAFEVFREAESTRIYHPSSKARQPAQRFQSLIRITNALQKSPQIKRKELRTDVLGDSVYQTAERDEHNSCIDSAVRLMLMIDCSTQDRLPNSYRSNLQNSSDWRDEESFEKFVTRSLEDCLLADQASERNAPPKRAIKAWKLEKRARVTFRPTNTLGQHLTHEVLNGQHVVYIFHNTAYLKARLRKFQAESLDLDIGSGLTRGSVPPRLLFETLASIQDILFPVEDPKSQNVLSNLVHDRTAYSFDGDMEQYQGYYISRSPPRQYMYWRNRLHDLHRLVTNPPARNSFTRWLERHTTERNALNVAILGLFLSALFGLLGFIVGVIQTILAYRAINSST